MFRDLPNYDEQRLRLVPLDLAEKDTDAFVGAVPAERGTLAASYLFLPMSTDIGHLLRRSRLVLC